MRHTDFQRVADELEPVAENARDLAERLGLDGYPVKYWIVDYDEMNQLIARDGFPTRYPHWRWGMKYDRQRKESRYGGGKAFEIVVNDDPSHAYLQESNSLADQKAVITHVEAHVDFFSNNRWFQLFDDEVDAVRMLERHAERIEEIMDDSGVDRDEVERFMDSVLAIADTIDQHQSFEPVGGAATDAEAEASTTGETGGGSDGDSGADDLAELDVSEEVRNEVFDEEVGHERDSVAASETAADVLAFLRRHGKQYDEESGKATEMATWQKEVLQLLRKEAHYFAPQRMTKVMNEGWAAYWESIMMGEEAFAGVDEFLTYAEHQSMVLGSPGLNPYKLGKELWEYLENVENRREVVEKLLRVDGITWENFHDVVDFDRVRDLLAPPEAIDRVCEETLDDLAAVDAAKVDRPALARARSGDIDVERYPWKVLTYEGLAHRHFSLLKPQYRGFLSSVDRTTLEQIDRYQFDDQRYDDVEEAVADVEYTAGWDAMYDVRASHNDVTFLEEYLTGEFVRENDYFTYEFSHASGDFRVASTDPEDVTNKLLVQFANFGKPTITVEDGNYENRNELLLAHQYNGIQLEVGQAIQTLERVFDLWGRPVNLKTIVKEVDEEQHDLSTNAEPTPEERGKLLRYDGEDVTVEDLPWVDVEDIAATEVDYNTKPDDWL